MRCFCMYVALGGKKGKEQVTVRESTRIPGTNRKKTKIIKNYGFLADRLKENPNFIEDLKAELSKGRESKRLEKKITISLPTDTIDNASDQNPCYRFGHMIVKRLWEIMRLDKFFDEHCKQKNREEVKKAIFMLIASRLGMPSSIRSIERRQVNYAGDYDVTLDVLYSVLDVLSEDTEELIEHFSSFFNNATTRNTDVVSYDVTNYYFESTKQGQLRLFGFSKEHKNNEVLVVMGLLIDSNGIPVTMKLFPGNTMDQNTLTASISELEKLYRIKEITVVADRGMNSGDNLVFISDSNHHFVISYTLKKAKQEVKEQCLNGEWEEVETDPITGEMVSASKVLKIDVTAKVSLSEEEIDKLRKERKEGNAKGRTPKYRDVKVPAMVHVTYSKKRAEKDKYEREKALERAQKRAENEGLLNRVLRYGANKYLEIDIDKSKVKLNQAKIEEDKQWDGYYAVITDKMEMSTAEAMEIYGGQWKIEECFRILKTDLEARPVRVSTDAHIRGHFMMCYMALCILRYMQYMLKEKELDVMSAERLMSCIHNPIVVVAGDYPKIVLQPTNLSEDFLSLISILGFPKLERNMTATRFRAVTKLSLDQKIQSLI